MNESPNIYTAINEVMQQVGYVQKTGQMRGGGNYKYAGEAEIIATIRPAMVDAGIIMYPAGVHDMRIDTYPTKNSSMNHVVAIYTWVFTHAESSTSIEVMTVGEGADVGDKSANKSMTAAKKYALLQTFLIETGNDPDDSSSQDMQRTASTEQQYSAPTPRPQDAQTTPNNADEAHALIDNALTIARGNKKLASPTEWVELSAADRKRIHAAIGDSFTDSEERYTFATLIGFPASTKDMDRAQRSTFAQIAGRRDAKKIIKLIINAGPLFAE